MKPTHHVMIRSAPTNDSKRVQPGDVIAIRTVKETEKRGGFGKVERKNYLIIPVAGIDEATINIIDKPCYADGSYGPVDLESPMPEQTAKRRYNFPLDLLKQGWAADMSIKDAEDPAKDYQPLLDSKKEFAVDCSEKVAVFFDKYTKSYKYSTTKEAT